MNDFNLIYKILWHLQNTMDRETRGDMHEIAPGTLGVSLPRWSRIMKMLVDEGFVTGVYLYTHPKQEYMDALLIRPEITLSGLEYLEYSPFMKEAAIL